jgi:hypothetical protein
VTLGEISPFIRVFKPRSNIVIGAVGGSIVCALWVYLYTFFAPVLGDFQVRHPNCHNIADMAGLVGGPILREVVGFLFIIA